jgi:curved DNA-binding protein CbpA
MSQILGASHYYKILGLSSGASLHAVKKAYRSLVKEWHPDRFHGNIKLYKKCEEKLKQVNGAHDWLESHLSGNNYNSTSAETTGYAYEQAEQDRREAEAWAREDARARAEEEARAREEARVKAEAKEKKKKRAEERAFAKKQNEAAIKTFKRFRRLARQGIVEVQFRLAMMYRDGIGCARNQKEAYERRNF